MNLCSSIYTKEDCNTIFFTINCGGIMNNIIEVKDLVKRYKRVLALNHFDMSVREGEIFGLLGPNGSGKSTAINCILGLLNFSNGEIQILGREMSPLAYDIKSQIGLVPQEVAVIENLTVRENIDFFCGLYVDDKKKRKGLVDEAIDFLELGSHEKFYPKKLSGGLKRRLNIACGIAHKPKIIFLDEPTVAVDVQTRNRILEGIKELNRSGSTIIYTTHYIEEVEKICDRVMIMDKGQSLLVGTKEELSSSVNLHNSVYIKTLSEVGENILSIISKMNKVHEVSFNDSTIKIKSESDFLIGEVLNSLEEKDIVYTTVNNEVPSLSDVFIELTGRELRENV